MLGVNIKKKVTVISAISVVILVIFYFSIAHAGTLDVGLTPVNDAIGLGSGDIRVVIARVINVVLSLLGIVALLIVLYGGFLWMMAGGDQTKIDTARGVLVNGAIGLAIILSAWGITLFILNALVDATTGRNEFNLGTPSTPSFCNNCSSLGRGIIDSHYPDREQNEVPRNTNIMIQFKYPILLTSIIEDYDDGADPVDPSDDTTDLNTDTLKIYQTSQDGDQALASDEVVVRFTPDKRSFVFDPVDLLGSASTSINYTVELTGDGLRVDDGTTGGRAAFSGIGDDNGYEWTFTTSTILDTTPPIVENFYPSPETRPVPPYPSSQYERNVLIMVNFNEAIDPTTVTRVGNMTVKNADTPVAGAWSLVNNFRSAEFIPALECGTNSCSEKVYCLPASASINVLVKTAQLANLLDLTSSLGVWPTGVMDAASNALNGLGNSLPGGQIPGDNVGFNFSTSAVMDTTPPTIASYSPIPPWHEILTHPAENVPDDQDVVIQWSEIMSASSINTDSVRVRPLPDHQGMWYQIISGFVTENIGGVPVPFRSTATLKHAKFYRADIGATPQQGYIANATSQARDVYQNCFIPADGPVCNPTSTLPSCCNGQPQSGLTCGASPWSGPSGAVPIGP